MAAIERELGITSTWYFRWRTAEPDEIATLQRQGFKVGLHYETRSRRALASGRGAFKLEDGELADCRAELRREIDAFRDLYGVVDSIAPHGDSRVPEVSNAVLMQGEEPADYGVAFDANEAMRGRGLAYWLTDRAAPDGRWKDGVDPLELLRKGTSPMLCLTHPNNWASGLALWVARIRSRSDEPPL
jgi:hypothetical protein